MSDHLGGFVPGGDPNTYYPKLWAWLKEKLDVKSVIDVGCGDGVAIDFFASLGCDVQGVDGVFTQHSAVTIWDYTKGPLTTDRQFDLCWSCEFVEHVEERYVGNFLKTFGCADIVAMTHAVPGQAGHHHVNCRDADYWKRQLASVGFSFDLELTTEAREITRQDEASHNYFALTGMVFTS